MTKTEMKTGAVYYGDCLKHLAAWHHWNKSLLELTAPLVDLIYLDPPFNSNRNYGAPTAKSKESDTGSMDAFTDMWTYDQQAYDRTERICKTTAHPACELISGLRSYLEKRDDGMLAYLTYMADRLWLLHDLLKETGSIYLHCDPSANYYLRLLMDAVFGAEAGGVVEADYSSVLQRGRCGFGSILRLWHGNGSGGAIEPSIRRH